MAVTLALVFSAPPAWAGNEQDPLAGWACAQSSSSLAAAVGLTGTALVSGGWAWWLSDLGRTVEGDEPATGAIDFLPPAAVLSLIASSLVNAVLAVHFGISYHHSSKLCETPPDRRTPRDVYGREATEPLGEVHLPCAGTNRRTRYKGPSSPCVSEKQTRLCLGGGVWGAWEGTFSYTTCGDGKKGVPSRRPVVPARKRP